MRNLVVSLTIAAALTGCAASKPPGNADFARARSLHELDGVYANVGEGAANEGAPYLTELIWPRDSTIWHRQVMTLDVRAASDKDLHVRAFEGGGQVVKEQTFVAGKDFDFRSGRLRIYRRWKNSAREPEAGGLFFVRETKELGVDTKHQGKYKMTEGVVGAAYLVVPIVARITTEVRFKRVKD